ncbi:solute carrier family 23 member 1-like [Tubulanus polymorphus]|uniref:solute carrier family 23 member 1-like n=1 Tax=Tubulanus polymorphus TaxID=672921 RepID=UPI003DA42D80
MADNPAFERTEDLDAVNGGPSIKKDKDESSIDGVNDPPPHVAYEIRDAKDARKAESDVKETNSDKLSYSIEECPPWHTCILLGFQHYLTMFGATIAIPMLLAKPLCMANDHLAIAEVIGTIFFVSGLVTLLQSTIGSRLPIIQGGTFSFLVPTFAILSLPKWKCPAGMELLTNKTQMEEIWQPAMREIQGSIAVAALFQVVIGFTGIIGIMLRFIGPLAITPTIALVGLSLFEAAAGFSSKQWWIALLTIALIALFSQYLRRIQLPCCKLVKGQGCVRQGFPLFTLFPVILSIAIVWLLSYALTVTDVFPKNETMWGYAARTDVRSQVLQSSKWFRFPYPGQWGLPTVSVSGVFGMLAGVLASMIESVGDYYACARLAGAPPPPVHAINRGIGIEGIGCVLAGLWGSGNGTTSYSENIGAIGITKVGSRRVIQVGAVFMMLFGIFGKFGALFVTIPDPVVGGVFFAMFGMITAVGLSNLQFIDLNSTRNLFILGFSLMFGIALPQWMKSQTNPINTGNEVIDQIFTVLLSTSMFVGGFIGFVLDNTVPGTKAERGLDRWKKQLEGSETGASLACYDFPIGMSLVNRSSFCRYLPFCPPFAGVGECCRKQDGDGYRENKAPEVKVETQL